MFEPKIALRIRLFFDGSTHWTMFEPVWDRAINIEVFSKHLTNGVDMIYF